MTAIWRERAVDLGRLVLELADRAQTALDTRRHREALEYIAAGPTILRNAHRDVARLLGL